MAIIFCEVDRVIDAVESSGGDRKLQAYLITKQKENGETILKFFSTSRVDRFGGTTHTEIISQKGIDENNIVGGG
jgi:hypothetical protein